VCAELLLGCCPTLLPPSLLIHVFIRNGAKYLSKYTQVSPYHAVNTFHIGSENQSVNAIWGNNRYLLWNTFHYYHHHKQQ
jgi:hypothetical protein